MTVPYTFANASGYVPASELDANFAAVSEYSNTAGTVTASAQPNITSVGRLTSLTVTGNISGSYILGNGSQLTGIVTATYNNSNVTSLLSSFGSNTISTTGNITAGYFVGNGSQLTGITVVSSYGNSNVTSLLSSFGSNTISTTGNITAGRFIGNGSALTSLTGANVSGTVARATTAATANAVAGANVSGTVANATYATSAGSATTAGTVTTNAQPNITSVGTLTNLSVSGNIIVAGNLFGSNSNLYLSANSSESWSTWLINNDSTNYAGPNNSALVVPYSDSTYTGVIMFQSVGGNAQLLSAGPGNGPILSNAFNIITDTSNIVLTTNSGNYSSVFDTTGNVSFPGDVTATNVSVSGNIIGNTIVAGNLFGSNSNLYLSANASESWSTWLINNDSLDYAGPNNSALVVPYSDSNYTGVILFQGVGGNAQLLSAGPGNGPILSNAFNIITDTSNIVLSTDSGNYSSVFDITGNISFPGNVTTSGTVITAPVALSTLTATSGARAFVNDGNLAAAGNFGVQIGSGGANIVPVWSNGSNWYIG